MLRPGQLRLASKGYFMREGAACKTSQRVSGEWLCLRFSVLVDSRSLDQGRLSIAMTPETMDMVLRRLLWLEAPKDS